MSFLLQILGTLIGSFIGFSVGLSILILLFEGKQELKEFWRNIFK